MIGSGSGWKTTPIVTKLDQSLIRTKLRKGMNKRGSAVKREEKSLLRACAYVWEQTHDAEAPRHISLYCEGALSIKALRSYVLSSALHLAEEKGLERINGAG